MAESDSDAFESADEEVEDRKQKKADVKKVIHEKKDTADKSEVKSEEPVHVKTPDEEPQPKVEVLPTSSWRSWGAFNVISNASKTVASITTHVSQSIIDSMNIPDPEEMARLQAEEKKKVQGSEDKSETDDKSSEKSDDSRFKLDSLLSGVSQISSKVVSGGLDTLEGIGKKTINILQETDPNIKNKIRNINNQPNLSDLLKEAKDRDEAPPSTQPASSYTFEHLLDEYKGMVFLEALEILSNQSKMKIDLLMKPLNGKVLAEMQETLDEVKELCELDTENFDESITAENVESKLQAATEDLNVKLNFTDIVTHSKESQQWLDELDSSVQPSSIYQESIHVMAKACALSLNNLQKLAELLLSQDHRSTADESDSLTQLASIYCSLFNHFATKFNEKLTTNSSSDESKKLATNVFLESSNAITQVKKAFSLFLPILQIGAV